MDVSNVDHSNHENLFILYWFQEGYAYWFSISQTHTIFMVYIPLFQKLDPIHQQKVGKPPMISGERIKLALSIQMDVPTECGTIGSK